MFRKIGNIVGDMFFSNKLTPIIDRMNKNLYEEICITEELLTRIIHANFSFLTSGRPGPGDRIQFLKVLNKDIKHVKYLYRQDRKWEARNHLSDITLMFNKFLIEVIEENR